MHSQHLTDEKVLVWTVRGKKVFQGRNRVESAIQTENDILSKLKT